RRPGEDSAKAAGSLWPLAHIELQLVEPLLIEDQHALGAMDLEADQVLAPPGGAARSERAGNAALEAHDRMRDILILDFAHLIRAGHRALFDHGSHIGRDGGDIAQEEMRK